MTIDQHDMKQTKERPGWKPFVVYLVIILLSFVIFYPAFYQQSLAIMEAGNYDRLSPTWFTILTLVQPFVLTLLALVGGHFLAYKLDLNSVIYQAFESDQKPRENFIKALKPGVCSGALYGIVIVIFDVLLRPWLPELFSQSVQMPDFITVIGNVFYGGVVEEIMLRFGLMTVILYLITFAGQKNSQGKVIFVIIFQSLLFALGHLPATQALFEMTPVIWMRMLLFNGIGGLIFGWLYYRYHLEAAIISHMSTHIASALLSVVLALIGI